MAKNSPDDLELSEELVHASTILDASKLELGVDIDSLLNEKAKKNQLNSRNVKLLLKNILTNDDVVTMLKQTLDENIDGNCLYEPKLTRAKIREMLKTYPSSVEQWSPNQQQSIISEFKSLIDKEFPDDSEDEEYKPEPQLDDDYEDDYDEIYRCTSIHSPRTENVNTNEEDLNTSAENKECDEETIGMRTRSKFPLNDTPLETIEQAFIPPDITEDMYDSSCENDEWLEFLSEFKKPLEPVQNDDTEDDPEYNVLGDAEFSNVDKEEFRKDRAVKVSRKEFKELMKELNEYTDSYVNFNGVEEHEENDTTITESDETIAEIDEAETIRESDKAILTSSKNPSPTNIVNSNYGDCHYNSYTSHTNSENTVGLENNSTIYKLSFPESDPNNTSTAYDRTQKKTPKRSSLSYYTKNFSDWDNDKSVANNEQTTDLGSSSVQINVPPLKVQTLQEYLEKRTIAESNIQATDNVDTETTVTKKTTEFTETTDSCPQNNQMSNSECKQTILLKQQLTQHVQLLAQNYLLCSITSNFRGHCPKLIIMAEAIKEASCNKRFEPLNIQSAIQFMNEWKTGKKYKLYLDKACERFPTELRELMLYYDKPLFVYPQLLPVKTYRNNFKVYPVEDSEERVMVLKIDEVYRSLKTKSGTKSRYKTQNLLEMLDVILKTIQQKWFTYRKLTDIKQFVTRRRSRSSMSILKNYLMNGQIDETVHVVDIGPVFVAKCLHECSIDKFPVCWRSLAKYAQVKKCVENYKAKNK